MGALAASISLIAKESDETTNEKITQTKVKDILKKYDIKNVKFNSLPDDVTPLEMTLGEFEEFVSSTQKEPISSKVENTFVELESEVQTRSFTIPYRPYMNNIVGMGAYVQTYADLVYMDSGSIVNVSKVKSSLKGLIVGLSLSDENTNYTLLDGSKTIKIVSDYRVNNVIIVEGIGVIYWVDYRATVKWNTLSGYSIRSVQVLDSAW